MLFTLVPALTIAFFAYDSLSNKIQFHDQSKVTYGFVLTTSALVNIVTALQTERALDAANSDIRSTNNLEVYLTNQQRKTDDAINDYVDFIKTIESTPKEWFREKEFEYFQRKLDALDDIRYREKGAEGFERYSEIVRSILSIIQSLQTQSGDALLSSKISVYSLWLSLQELFAQERALINSIFTIGKINAKQSYAINSLINKQKQLLNAY